MRCSRSSRSRGAPSPPSGSATSTARGEVGVIPSVTRPFCEQCDRIRLTADGQLRSCLFSLEDHDLRGAAALRGDDEELSDAIEACVGAKWAGHAIGQVQFVKPRRSMSQIGG